MTKPLRMVALLGAALVLPSCQDDGPSADAMEKAWLAWAGRQKVHDFEKVSCKPQGEARWMCRFRTRHRLRRGSRRATLVANRSGIFRTSGGRLTYRGKQAAAE